MKIEVVYRKPTPNKYVVGIAVDEMEGSTMMDMTLNNKKVNRVDIKTALGRVVTEAVNLLVWIERTGAISSAPEMDTHAVEMMLRKRVRDDLKLTPENLKAIEEEISALKEDPEK